jgi:hydrogenase/urease accessory protein HupE
MCRWLWIAMIAALALVGPAQADELRPGYLAITQEDAHHWHVQLKAPVKGGLAANANPVMPAYCTAGPPVRHLEGGSLYSDWHYDCSEPLVGAKVGLSGLDKTVTDALVRIAPLGRPVQAARLSSAVPTTEVAARAGPTQVAGTYFALGIGHILSGYDHLLFVLSLVLLLGGGWVVARTVTAFTIAHSITLAGATLGFLGVSQQPVEICIALSIVFLSVEVVKRDPTRLRLSERIPWVVAFLFGLLHGFGFAGALAEIGLPEGEVPMALLTFNLGVEVGQLAIVVVALATLVLLGRISKALRAVLERSAAYAIGITASFWLIVRAVS